MLYRYFELFDQISKFPVTFKKILGKGDYICTCKVSEISFRFVCETSSGASQYSCLNRNTSVKSAINFSQTSASKIRNLIMLSVLFDTHRQGLLFPLLVFWKSYDLSEYALQPKPLSHVELFRLDRYEKMRE